MKDLYVSLRKTNTFHLLLTKWNVSVNWSKELVGLSIQEQKEIPTYFNISVLNLINNRINFVPNV